MASSPLSPERINLPPFGRVKVRGSGTIALLSGSAPWLWLEEDKDLIRIDMGASLMTGQLPHGGAVLELHNPFSFQVVVYIARGMPPQSAFVPQTSAVSVSNRMMNGDIVSVGGCNTLAAVTNNKRAVILGAYRGSYWVTIGGFNASDDIELYRYKGLNAAKVATRPVGFVDAGARSIVMMRQNGAPNSQLQVGAGGYDFTLGDLAAFEASAGVTRIASNGFTTAADVRIDPDMGAMIVLPTYATIRPQITAVELGDQVMEFRGAL